MAEHRSVVPDVTQLRAITHPMRMRMLGLLRTHGPSTASRLAERLNLNTGQTSYHLRQLEKHGFVEDAPELGDKRDRWWRATAAFTTVEATATDDEGRDAEDAFYQAILTGYAMRLQQAAERRSTLPDQWRPLSTSSDALVFVTPGQASDIQRRLRQALTGILDDYLTPPGEAAEGTMPYEIQIHGLPRPDDSR